MRFDYDTSYQDSKRLLRYRSDQLIYGLTLALLLAAPWLLPKYYVGELTYLYIMAIASLGLMVLSGYTGQVSLGHAAFLAVGAYAHAWFLGQGLPFAASILLATALSGLVGLALGLPAIRVSGLYLAMVTLAFAILIEHVLGRWKSVTGGFNGMPVADPSLFGLDLSGLKSFYFLCLGCLIVILLLLINLMRGRTGRAFVGVRDSEAAAASLGIWVAGHKVLAFVISAAVSGFAGALLAHHMRHITPEGFSLLLSLELVLMVTIGGLGSLRGAILGAFLIGMVPAFISQIKPYLGDRISKQFGLEIFFFGLILAFFVLFEPKGLNGRWLKVKAFFETFPLYRKDVFRRGKTYMKSERYR
ncbi:MAG: branched-chain amino acid ABC transporter permease [Betaproteobacteria bacterium]